MSEDAAEESAARGGGGCGDESGREDEGGEGGGVICGGGGRGGRWGRGRGRRRISGRGDRGVGERRGEGVWEDGHETLLDSAPSPLEGFNPVRKWKYDDITMTLRNMAVIFVVLEKRGLQLQVYFGIRFFHLTISVPQHRFGQNTAYAF